jgi:hypothetical protein
MPTAQLVWLGGIDLEKTNERGSNQLRSGSQPNSIGAERIEAIGHRMTHSQGSNSSPNTPR